MVEQKGINAYSNQRIVTVEDNLNKKLNGLKNDFEHKWDNLQDSIENLIDQQQCPPEGGCLTDTMVEDQCQQQGLSESSYSCAVVCPWEKKEEILPLLSKEGSGEGAVEEHQENNLLLPPTDSVYILPTLAAQSTPKTPTIKATPSPLPILQNFRKLLATTQIFATTSKKMATAHIAWHNGWFRCSFGFGASELRHF